MSRTGPTQADTLIDLSKTAVLFHAPNGTCFADIGINGHRETWPIHSGGFKDWLTRSYFRQTNRVPSSQAMQSAMGVIQSRATIGRQGHDTSRSGPMEGINQSFDLS